MSRIRYILNTALAAVVLLLLCCQCSSVERHAKAIPYTVLNNYYVRNTIDSSKAKRVIVDNQRDFDAFFGPAAIMGGKSTPIDWSKQYVVATVMRETNRNTMVTPLAVKQKDNIVILKYRVIKGHKINYTQVPFTAVALDKPADTENIEFIFIEK